MEAPEFLHGRLNEIANMDADGADKRRLWAVILGLKPMKDGDMWCILWGDDLQSGVAGFGPTPAEAISAFEFAMCQKANIAGQGPAINGGQHAK